MRYSIRRVPYDRVAKLDRKLFPGCQAADDQEQTWYAALSEDGSVAGFAGVGSDEAGFVVFLRAGVAQAHRGRGLQRRLIRARLGWARRQGCRAAYTYTMPWNIWSSNNLLSCGFRLYRSRSQWAGSDVLYWCRNLEGK